MNTLLRASHLNRALRRCVSTLPDDTNQPIAKLGRDYALGKDDAHTWGPAVTRLLNQVPNLSLDSITPTGRNGRILKGDVLLAIESNPVPMSKSSPVSIAAENRPSPKRASDRPTYTDMPVSSMQTSPIFRPWSTSKSSVPHQYTTAEYDLNPLLGLCNELNLNRAATKLSITDFIVKAAGLALQRVPEVNVRWDDNIAGISSNDTIDVSITLSKEAQTIVPVITHVDRRSVVDIATLITEFTLGQSSSESPEGGGGCLNITNLGDLGISRFAAIINPPQSGILAIGTPCKYRTFSLLNMRLPQGIQSTPY